jgi:hypothetical protein
MLGQYGSLVGAIMAGSPVLPGYFWVLLRMSAVCQGRLCSTKERRGARSTPTFQD